MAHIAHISDKQNLNVACPDGFANQLRLLLAGVYLCLSGVCETYNQEWILNNHNNVNFKDYFNPLPKVTMNKISSDVDVEEIVTSCSFLSMMDTKFGKEAVRDWPFYFRQAIKFLIPRSEILDIINLFAEKFEIEKCLGVHVRRTCKTALLSPDQDIRYRTPSGVLTNEDVLNVCKNYDKIYLATDNAETQNFFKRKLKNKLVYFAQITEGSELFHQEYSREKVNRYTTPLHTILDLFLLKKCKIFLGSSESSLSLILKEWRDNKEDFPIFGKL